jgi:hypothetical protein
MMNKTSIIAALLSTLVAIFFLGARLSNTNMVKILFHVSILSPVILVFFLILIEVRYGSFVDMIATMFSTGSFIIRLEMWDNAIWQLITNYSQYLILGAGPDFIDSGNQSIAKEFKINGGGGIEGNVDSTYINNLLDLGLLGSVFFFAIYVSAFKILFRCIRILPKEKLTSFVFLSLFGGMIFLVFAFFTQSMGYAKISWLPFQVLLIIFSYGSSPSLKHFGRL